MTHDVDHPRRELLRSIVRTAALVALGGLAARILLRPGRCRRLPACARCPEFPGCELPRARADRADPGGEGNG